MAYGVPRERIPWFPTIDDDECEGCGTCTDFCKNGVLELRGNPPKALVVKPYNCVVMCSACSKLCPNAAISFPPRSVILEAARKYHQKR